MSQQLATFELAGHLFGVDVDRVQEVIRNQTTTRVPLAPAAIGGLINRRGQVVTAIDLRERLGLPSAGPDHLPMNVVVRTSDGPVSLFVDVIGEVIDTDDELFESPPETLTGPGRELILGVHKLKDRLVLALDVDRAVDISATA
ncbi:chemotaxis protein CheW [mine drainage metagenome]|uniref:Chemotaxis protein CheW n=1 Tax=mine drainage metagenome TaxID=410659 RepID=A0A1J5PEJ8_9ZZZZ